MSKIGVTTLAMIAASLNSVFDQNEVLMPLPKDVKPRRPEFTTEELAYLRSLPKKKKKCEVEKLRAKYAQIEKDRNGRS